MTPILPQVKNIVMLMLENRSLDNLLGWLYDGDQPENVFPQNSPAGLRRPGRRSLLQPGEEVVRAGSSSYPVVPVPDDLGSDLDRVPAYDPYEPLKEDDDWYGVMNQLYGDANRIVGAAEQRRPGTGHARLPPGLLLRVHARAGRGSTSCGPTRPARCP